MNWFTQLRPKIRSFVKKSDVPDNLWAKCPGCEQMIFSKDLDSQSYVCRYCQHHFQIPVTKRMAMLFDNAEYSVLPMPSVISDPIHFKDQKRYVDRLKDASAKSGSGEAITVAKGYINGRLCMVSCFNFSFIGGSMGIAVGEALLMAAQESVSLGAPYIVIPSSGGARMQEGILSLMQMARSVIAVIRVKEKKIPFISVMTHPTTGGVAASFAALGDIIIAEPNAIIGFTGARVIQETLKRPLPDGFQTAEFQKAHGFVDMIVHRTELKSVIGNICSILCHESDKSGTTFLSSPSAFA
ncbi:acetyl-CoA carboxylase carboxyltransferase subunit beta [Candidatus Hydrogenosomobacter endosymbioticus]|uniref:Acetyl-coenzyme A carboxylase carboxyl transferase subunit beta n=1 Tax=Candidatus Hydrogenosomobacter endosymbioticus TaxID=2558174 RepID=A0ABM7V8X3_9PROT|nr:acetyl-CoA carboxylase carboxyltransferase subunit beta [Candidatus Hydrogenosomobacter endosymbioticus]BDB96247.1 acetyl-coenzyme A carboxylase carboxyl transferase subunit beta [Candidatus Hydrogenosomobacter endosymbioticus]